MRTLLPLPEPEQRGSGLSTWIDEAVAKKKPPKKRASTGKNPRGYKTACAEAMIRAKAEDWEDAKPKHLVGLYAVLHEQVYRVPPTELVDSWNGAVSAARAMLDKEFEGDVFAFVEFIRWTWQRTRRRQEKAIANGEEVRRVGWALQFKHRDLLTDYRVEIARQQETAKPKGRR